MTKRDDKVAIVTGAGQGIGKGIARKLLDDGYLVAIADIDEEAAKETAAEFGGSGTAVAVQVDVADEAAVEVLVESVLSRFGRIDAVVNNAGLAGAQKGAVETLDLADWTRTISVNLTGVFLCCKHAIPALRETRGSIVNIASTRALQSECNTEAYSASKGGVVALTHALAVSLGPDIRVNCISPGWIAVDDRKKRRNATTPALRPEDHAQHPAGRVGTPSDIAELTAFLLSSRSGFITGQNFVVDGGMTRKMIYLD